MERYYFREYRKWIKEIRNKKNLKCSNDFLTNFLLVAFLIFWIVLFVSMCIYDSTIGKKCFWASLILLPIDEIMIYIFQEKHLTNIAFEGRSVYMSVCEEIIEKFKKTFDVTRVEHYENILQSMIEERNMVEKEINNPRKKIGGLMMTVFVPLLIAILKENFLYRNAAILILLSLFGLWGIALLFSSIKSGKLYDYDDFIGYIREIINIKKGFYKQETENE